MPNLVSPFGVKSRSLKKARTLEIWCAFDLSTPVSEQDRLWIARSPICLESDEEDVIDLVSDEELDERESSNQPCKIGPLQSTSIPRRNPLSRILREIRPLEMSDLLEMERKRVNSILPTAEEAERMLEQAGVTIPTHFIDPISCTLMLEPRILPSGQRIDTETREATLETSKSYSHKFSSKSPSPKPSQSLHWSPAPQRDLP